MVAERHTTTATSDATGHQLQNWRATTQEPIRDHGTFHSRHDRDQVRFTRNRYQESLVAEETRDKYQDSLVAYDSREWIERKLTTVEDDTDGTDENYNVDTTTAERPKPSVALSS